MRKQPTTITQPVLFKNNTAELAGGIFWHGYDDGAMFECGHEFSSVGYAPRGLQSNWQFRDHRRVDL